MPLITVRIRHDPEQGVQVCGFGSRVVRCAPRMTPVTTGMFSRMFSLHPRVVRMKAGDAAGSRSQFGAGKIGLDVFGDGGRAK